MGGAGAGSRATAVAAGRGDSAGDVEQATAAASGAGEAIGEAATGKAMGTGGAAEALAALSTPLALATALDAIGVGGALLDQAWTANPNLTLALT